MTILGFSFDVRGAANPVTAADLASHQGLTIGRSAGGFNMSGLTPSVLDVGITGNKPQSEIINGHCAINAKARSGHLGKQTELLKGSERAFAFLGEERGGEAMRGMEKLIASVVVTLGILSFMLVGSAGAGVIDLTFEGLQNNEHILNFYNGGTGSLGSSGPNFGISFGADALALIDADNGGNGNFANEPTPDTVAYFLTGPGVVMNVPAGFDTGFSFFYTSSLAASVTVYDGLNATGNILGTLNLNVNWKDNNCTGDPTGDFCHWDPIGVSFSGTALSVNFGGTVNQVGFDDITLGSATPVPGVPEPSTLLLLGSGLAGLGGIVWRRHRRG